MAWGSDKHSLTRANTKNGSQQTMKALIMMLEPLLLLVRRIRHATGAVQVVPHDRRLGRRHRWRGRR
ncbi:hypothetical protein WN48_02633 [Eufriesea mexicana]|uniref:Uncharacterized protein n=1 Tax=Eufriesea mexicana TaxID=516756 RepID=A0A310SGC8_9HYME|nr:hypothetical protein WN48_02633 [Eufriesea mexicana]